MNCCQRPKAEGNSSSKGPTDHLLPENPDNNCFVIPHFLELCSMMNGQAPDKMNHYTTQNVITFFFFLSLMNHFSRQNTNAIAYKITDFFFFKPHSRYCQQKFLKTIFSSRPRTFFFRRSSNDCSIAPRYSFSIFYAVLKIFFVFLLSLSSRIIFIQGSKLTLVRWPVASGFPVGPVESVLHWPGWPVKFQNPTSELTWISVNFSYGHSFFIFRLTGAPTPYFQY